MSNLDIDSTRKNPKEMSLEELEQYILRNRSNNQISNKYCTDKALTEVDTNSRNINRNIAINSATYNDYNEKNCEDNPSRLKSSNNMLQSNFSSQMDINRYSNVYNPFIANSSEMEGKEANITHNDLNHTDLSNVCQENNLKTFYKHQSNMKDYDILIENKNNNNLKIDKIPSLKNLTDVPLSNFKSNAAQNAISSYQLKINTLELRNKTLEDEVLKLRELHSIEKKKLNEDYYLLKNKENESEETLIKRLNQNDLLIETKNKELNEAKNMISYLNRVTTMLEQEKERHLEQNAKEKEDYLIENELLRVELNELKSSYNNLNQEYDDLKNNNQSYKDLGEKMRRENERLKLLIHHYEEDRRDMLHDIQSLKHINNKIENEKLVLLKKIRQAKQKRFNSVKSCSKQSKGMSNNQNIHNINSSNQKIKNRNDINLNYLPCSNEREKKIKNKRNNSLSHKENTKENNKMSDKRQTIINKCSSLRMVNCKNHLENNSEEEKVSDINYCNNSIYKDPSNNPNFTSQIIIAKNKNQFENPDISEVEERLKIVNNQIFELERHIADSNRNYKRIFDKCHVIRLFI